MPSKTPRPALIASPASVPVVEAAKVPPLKVYLTAPEREAFEREAGSHSQSASGYARFILQSRADPLLFLQLCRLRDPAFAQHLLGNPNDAGRVVELEKTLAELSNRADLAERDRSDAVRRAEEAERRLAECQERAHELAGHVVELHRAHEANRERMMGAGTEYEEVPGPTRAILGALTIAPRLARKDLEARLMETGISEQEASRAIAGAARLGLIVKGKDARYSLASPAGDETE